MGCVGLALARPQYYPSVYDGYNGLGYNAAPYAVASPYAVAAPAPVVTYEQNIIPDLAPAPVVQYAPVAVQPAYVPTEYKSQYHSQDELGQFSFGHISADQAHHQVRDYTGAVQGSYTYIDADGEQVVAHYIADSNGFRVSSNALPVAPTFDGVAPVGPVAPEVAELVAPVFTLEQVMETEEVMAARAEHFRLVAEHTAAVDAAIAAAAEVETEAPVEEEELPVEDVAEEEAPVERRKRQVFPVPVAYHPEFYSGLQAAPVDLDLTPVAPAAVAPVVHEGQLLRIENNPGHAVSYRVY